ncbi:MAG TPA: DUF5719 family protein [Acidimicrobiales bacterium]|nr:DUF5719 family protein [Acidimicrobiales bacterium]
MVDEPTVRPAHRMKRAPGRRSAPTPSSGPSSGTARRGPVLVAIVALLALGGLADRGASARPAIAAPVAPVPMAGPSGALSSEWFCAGAMDEAGSGSAGSVVVANPTGTPITGTITFMPGGAAATVPVALRVAAGSRQVIPESSPAGRAWIGAVVELDGGAATVEQQIDGPLGEAASPCATSGSARWYFSTGTTLRDASDELSLLNPYPADAIVDLSFATNDGVEEPNAFQAIFVPARSLVAVDLGSHLRRRASIATTVAVRTGRVVAWQTQVVTPPANGTPIVGAPNPAPSYGPIDPALPVGGVELTLGAPSPATKWWWPDGAAGGGVTEQYVVYNPGTATAQLRLTYGLDQGGAQPVAVTVGPASVVSVTTNSQSQVPVGAAHDATLASTNGVPVVAERVVTALAPSPRTGLGALLGGRLAADRWLLGAGSDTAHVDEWVEVQNPGDLPVTASIAAVTAGGPVTLGGLQHLVVPPRGRLAVQLAKHVRRPFGGALAVTASGPIVVERDLYGIGAPGIDLALAVPLSP